VGNDADEFIVIAALFASLSVYLIGKFKRSTLLMRDALRDEI